MRRRARNSALRMEQRARATGLLDDAPPEGSSADPCEALPDSPKAQLSSISRKGSPLGPACSQMSGTTVRADG